MAISFELQATVRNDAGKGASRRLRREGKVPAILYGAGDAPLMLSLEHNPVMHSLENEAFYSHILNVNFGGKTVRAVLKDLQRHPYKPVIMHLDLQRVSEREKLRMNIPLHFLGEENAPSVKQLGGVVSHLVSEVEISCLPKDLPEYIEVDVSTLGLNETLHLSNLAAGRCRAGRADPRFRSRSAGGFHPPAARCLRNRKALLRQARGRGRLTRRLGRRLCRRSHCSPVSATRARSTSVPAITRGSGWSMS